MKRWLMPVIIIVVASVAAVTTFWLTLPVAQPLAVAIFLLLCPGLIIVQFLHLRDVTQVLTLACALSLALDAITASILLYSGIWSPHLILAILIVASLYGAGAQLIIDPFLMRRAKANPTQASSS